jgi:hypothetical protein
MRTGYRPAAPKAVRSSLCISGLARSLGDGSAILENFGTDAQSDSRTNLLIV